MKKTSRNSPHSKPSSTRPPRKRSADHRVGSAKPFQPPALVYVNVYRNHGSECGIGLGIEKPTRAACDADEGAAERIAIGRVEILPVPPTCGPNCGHTQREHKAFDQGVADGEAGVSVQPPYNLPNLREAWLTGHSVGTLNRRDTTSRVPSPGGQRACLRCGCTEDRACPGGCSWVEPADVCTACLTPDEYRVFNHIGHQEVSHGGPLPKVRAAFGRILLANECPFLKT